jgi:carbonic anhydrase
MKNTLILKSILVLVATAACAVTTAEQQKALTPETALQDLMEGNQRFVAGKPTVKDWKGDVQATVKGQHPKAVILSCIDSRVPVETVFDQGIGDVFVVREAGNIVGNQTLGSLEFSTKIAGAKLIVVLGHESCGAVKGAVGKVELGHLTEVLDQIQPAVQAVREKGIAGHSDAEIVDATVKENVAHSVAEIRKQSPILAELEKSGTIKIVGAYYSLKDGQVTLVK